MIRVKISFFLLASILCTFTTSAQFLKTDGQKIVDPNGKEIILRGIGLGGWMLQEGYMLKTRGPQHQIEAKIAELIGEEKTKTFYEAWLANHFTKTDMDSMASWGYNSVRLAMHYKLFTPPIEEEPVKGEMTWNEKGFKMVDDLLDWAEANRMYLILDLHAAPGGQGENEDISDYDRSKPSLWESEANQNKMIALWRKLAERYQEEPYMGAYDIINEPNWGFQDHKNDPNGCAENENTPVWDLQQKVTAAIREVDINHIIIIEGNCWGNNYRGLPELWDDNLVISFHKYWNPNTTDAIQGMLDMRNERNVPIWLGETGENSNTWFTDAIELFEANQMGWSWWPLKKLGYNNPLQIKMNDGYQEVLNYWSGKSEKPSEDKAYAAFMQLAEDLKIENNIYHPDVVDAMIRQPHTDETVPFKSNKITTSGENGFFATDFDLGREGFAYHDTESTNETTKPGGLAWNKGYTDRNDGVDITKCEDEITNGYQVSWTEADEWLQYTIDVKQAGAYNLEIRYRADSTNGQAKLLINNQPITKSIVLPSDQSKSWKSVIVKKVKLQAGTQRLKLIIEEGGFDLNYLTMKIKN